MSPAAHTQNAKHLAVRYLFFVLGLLINSFAIAAALSLLFFGRLQGVGLGTVVSALIVGPLVSLFGRGLPGLGRIRALRIP